MGILRAIRGCVARRRYLPVVFRRCLPVLPVGALCHHLSALPVAAFRCYPLVLFVGRLPVPLAGVACGPFSGAAVGTVFRYCLSIWSSVLPADGGCRCRLPGDLGVLRPAVSKLAKSVSSKAFSTVAVVNCSALSTWSACGHRTWRFAAVLCLLSA